MKTILTLLFTSTLALMSVLAQNNPAPRKAILLEDVTWLEAERVLSSNTVVVIPLGAAAKEHGPHLRLNNDFLMAEFLKQRVAERADVVIAPTVNYHFYPAFVEYPGSTSLRPPVARDLIVEICRSFSRFGVRRFYILNTGLSTLGPLKQSAEVLALDGSLLRYSDPVALIGPMIKTLSQQTKGTHADEIETSMMLHIAPATVDMRMAVKDYGAQNGPGPFTRDAKRPGHYSPTGVYGDATLATREKGEKLVTAEVQGILGEIEALRRAPLPDPAVAAAALDAFVGDYDIAADDRITIRREGNALYFRRNETPRVRIMVRSPGALWLPRGVEVTVVKDAKGQATHLVVAGATGDVLAKKTNPSSK